MARAPADFDQGWTPERSVAGRRSPWAVVAVISIATFMTVLDSSIVNVALDHIAGGMAASYDEASWVSTSFLIATAIIVPISGWLADVIGRKRYYMISVAAFTAASFCCGIAPNLDLLILARVVQGAAGGGLAAVEQSMLVDTFAPRQRGLAFAAYGMVIIIGPIFGPILGGWITDHASWRWCFLINVPIGALSLALVQAFVAEPEAMKRDREKRLAGGLKVDIVGFILVALALGGLDLTLDRGQQDDWFASSTIVATAAISAVAVRIFVPWEISRRDPIVKIDMFARRNFGLSNVMMVLVGVILFGTTLFIPQLLQTLMGYSSTEAGLALTLGGAATVIAMPISGVLTSRVDARFLIGFAFLIQALALWNFSHLDTSMSFQNVAVARMYQSVGIPFLFVPLQSVAYVGLAPTESNQASALMNVSRNLGGTVGIALVETLLAQRSQWHQSRLVEGLNPLNPNYREVISRMTHALVGSGQNPAAAPALAIGELYRAMERQATMLSYVDVFHVLMVIVLVSIPVLFFMRGNLGAGRRAPAAAP